MTFRIILRGEYAFEEDLSDMPHPQWRKTSFIYDDNDYFPYL